MQNDMIADCSWLVVPAAPLFTWQHHLTRKWKPAAMLAYKEIVASMIILTMERYNWYCQWHSVKKNNCIPRWQLNRVYMKLWAHHDYRVPSTVPLFNILEELCDQRGVLAGSCADPSPTHCIHQSTVLRWKWENGTHTAIVWPAHSK